MCDRNIRTNRYERLLVIIMEIFSFKHDYEYIPADQLPTRVGTKSFESKMQFSRKNLHEGREQGPIEKNSIQEPSGRGRRSRY